MKMSCPTDVSIQRSQAIFLKKASPSPAGKEKRANAILVFLFITQHIKYEFLLSDVFRDGNLIHFWCCTENLEKGSI